MNYLRVVLHKAIWVINYKLTVLFDDWLNLCVLCKRYGLEKQTKSDTGGDWVRDVSGMGCSSLWGHGMDALMPVPESGWQNLEDRRYNQGVGKTPVDLSVGLSRDQLNVSISPSLRSSSFSSGCSCSKPRLILGQWVAGLWGIFWGLSGMFCVTL